MKLILLICLSLATHADAHFSKEEAQKNIEIFFKKMAADPIKTMNEIPAKVSSNNSPVTIFTQEQIDSRNFVLIKDAARSQACKVQSGQPCDVHEAPRAGITAMNNPAALIGSSSPSVQNIYYLDESGLRDGRADTDPWSGSYWPMYSGAMAGRYASPAFPQTSSFRTHVSFKNSYAMGSGPLIELSPTEKYDILMGDRNYTLSNAVWAKAHTFANASGGIENWIGYCHGWAMAATQEPRPRRMIQVPAPNGQMIPFYPDDLKALASLTWAQNPSAQANIGGRCQVTNPAQDANGRITDQNCWDTNPGSWHIAIVNLLGRQGRTFIMDATYDYQVWNQPVLSYRIFYFNPIDNQIRDNVRDAMAPRNSFSDRFARYRSPYAQYIVGVSMEVIYLNESNASAYQTDSSANDRTKKVIYNYDLELDSNGQVIGGEWYQNAHPDFIWAVNPGATAFAANEGIATSNWNTTSPVPSDWARAAAVSSQKMQPLYRVMKNLIRQAQ